MSGLGSALRELAASAEPSAPAEPALLWDTGRRRVRRRRVAGAAVALGVIAAFSAVVLVPTPTVVMPAGQPHAPAIPENIYTPPTHLAGTAQEGPLGQLAVLSGAQRGSDVGLFGISARTGEYRFLDLGGNDRGAGYALSPDGNHVAFWWGPEHTPPNADRSLATGVATYDTRTGSVQKAPLPETGVRPGDLIWSGDHTLYFSYRVNGRAVGRIWQAADPSAGRPRPAVASIGQGYGTGFGTNRDGSVLLGTTAVSFDRYRVGASGTLQSAPPGLTLPDPATPQSPTGETQYGAVSRSGDLVLAVPFVAGALGHPLMVGVIPSVNRAQRGVDRVAKLSLVGQLQETWFLGWRDDHTALVIGMSPDGTGATPDLYAADLRARSLHRLGIAEPEHWGPHPMVATDLLALQMVPGRRPPAPRQLTGFGFVLAGLVLVLGPLGLLWFVRRRRRV